MLRELYIKNKSKNSVVIQHDDLKFDGDNMIIPSYYDSIIFDYLKYVDTSEMSEADKEDYFAFRKFFEDIMSYKSNLGGN